MDFVPEISMIAAVLADVTRARLLTQLLGGQALTAGELARETEVSPQTTSNHLSQLLTAGFIRVQAGADTGSFGSPTATLHSCSKR